MTTATAPMLDPDPVTVAVEHTLAEAAVTAAVLREVAPTSGPYGLEDFAYLADLDPATLVAAVRFTAAQGNPDLPPHVRTDRTLALLSERGITPPNGWTRAALARLAKTSITSIWRRESAAIEKLRRGFFARGITSATQTHTT